jgi:hypothetical protein
MKKLIFSTLFLVATLLTTAQTSPARIKGTLIDTSETNPEPAVGVQIIVQKGESFIYRAVTDIDGKFDIAGIEPGVYTLKIDNGLYKYKHTGIKLKPDGVELMGNVNIAPTLEVHVVSAESHGKLIDPNATGKTYVPKEMVKRSPLIRNENLFLTSVSTDIKMDAGGQVVIRGARPGSVVRFIDGVKESERSANLPARAIGRMMVYTGGIPAAYGDTTGGVIIIDTVSYFDLWEERNNP